MKGRWLNTGISLLKSFPMAYVVLISIALFKCSATKFIMSKFNLRYIYPFPLYFPSHQKKQKKQKTRTGKHIGYFNTVQPTLLWSSINPKYFSVISSHVLIPKFQTSFNSTVLFQQHLTRRVILLKSMPHTETKTSSTQNSSVVVHHSLDTPSVFPIIHRMSHKSLSWQWMVPLF